MREKKRTTDYGRIAPVYDKNPGRHQQPLEVAIEGYLRMTTGFIRVLDLACGTGNYLQAQIAGYARRPVRWHGADRSAPMLTNALRKNPEAYFVMATAERIPYLPNTFDIVACSFAFHHFVRKRQMLREVARILKPGGCFVLRDSCPELMWKDSWVYHFFPEAVAIDRQRFWSRRKLYAELTSCFGSCQMEATVSTSAFPYSQMLGLAANRDLSNLSLVSQRGYRRGLASIARASKVAARFDASFALVRCYCRKRVDSAGLPNE